MNKLTDKLNIKWKLLVILLTSGFVSFMLAAIFLILVEISDLKRTATKDLTTVSELIGNRSTAALLFDDEQVAQENLKALNQNPLIVQSCIYDHLGQVFATLDQLQAKTTPCPELIEFSNRYFKAMTLHLFVPIQLDEETIGAIYIHADLNPIFLNKLKNLSLVLFILVLASLLTFFIIMPLLGVITDPLAKLLATVNKITDEQNYALRASKDSDDEIGKLVDAFNNMIAIVDSQNRSLTIAKDRYLALYDDNPTMVFHLQLDGVIISVNQYGANQLNLARHDFNAAPIDDFIVDDDKRLAQELFDQCFKNPRQVHKQELRLAKPNGSNIWVRASARIIFDDQQHQNLLLVCEDVTETRVLNEKIYYQARHDALTGLANRTEFDEQIKTSVHSAFAGDLEHALCYLDLDQFKVVNDTCGHLAGDELLRQIGQLLKKQIRKDDLLARLGGDEFGILMHQCSTVEAAQACEKLKNIIRDFYFAWEDRRFNIGVSIGITVIDKHSSNAVDALKAADAACYVAKENGRNRVHIFRPDDEELATRQGEMQWLEKIQTGIDNNQFVLFGQTIKSISGHDQGLHFEVLLRYRDAQGNLIPPGAFLPAAERYHKASDLDKWVISHLFECLSKQPVFLTKLSLCSINLSGLTLSDESMQTFLNEQFDSWKIPAEKICFEITETAAISKLGYAGEFIRYWQQRGCSFSLDDFGSGLSSFAYLKNLPVDYLKIDGLFVKDIMNDKVNLAMVKSINEVGHVLGKKTIAEFVEDQAICQRLYEIGVDYAQGYGIAEPLPIEQLFVAAKTD